MIDVDNLFCHTWPFWLLRQFGNVWSIYGYVKRNVWIFYILPSTVIMPTLRFICKDKCLLLTIGQEEHYSLMKIEFKSEHSIMAA